MSAVALFDIGDERAALAGAAVRHAPVKASFAEPAEVASRSVNPVLHEVHHAGDTAMQSSGQPSTLVMDFARVIADALNRRVGQGRAIATKQFAYLMGVSEQSVWSWQGGYKAPSGPKLIRMLAFFDASFANEILCGCGLVAVKAHDLKTASYFRKVNDASMALRNIGQLCALADEPEAAE